MGTDIKKKILVLGLGNIIRQEQSIRLRGDS